MNRILFMVALGAFCTVVVAGCGGSSSVSGLLGLGGEWGELGEEVSAGPYRFRPPDGFKIDRKSPSMGRETKIMFRGPVSGKSEPGIIVSYASHHLDMSRQAPNWSEGVRMGLAPLRLKCDSFSSESSDSVMMVNGLPGTRVQFNGMFRHQGESRQMHGIAYILVDDTHLLLMLGMDFGPNSQSSIAKLEKSIKTVHRPGYTSPSYAWMNGGTNRLGPGRLAGRGTTGPANRPPFGGPGARPGLGGRTGYPGSSGSQLAAGAGHAAPTRPVDPAEIKRREEEMKRRREETQKKQLLLATAKDANHAQYFQANLELLQADSVSEKRDAVARMAQADPGKVPTKELRNGIAKALRDVAFDGKAHFATRQQAVAGLVVWGSTYSVPLLTELLEDENHFVKSEALKSLATLNDERAIEPITLLFISDASLRRQAADCLRSFGSKAEDKVLEHARPTDFIVTRATVQLLGDIGTDKSVDPLRSLRKLPFYRLVQADVDSALSKIQARGGADQDAS